MFTAISASYRDWQQTISPVMRQTHGLAEKLFVDFAGDMVPVFDTASGEERRAQIFVAALGASNYTSAEACWRERLRCLTWNVTGGAAFRHAALAMRDGS